MIEDMGEEAFAHEEIPIPNVRPKQSSPASTPPTLILSSR
jgi:hypothetical protein